VVCDAFCEHFEIVRVRSRAPLDHLPEKVVELAAKPYVLQYGRNASLSTCHAPPLVETKSEVWGACERSSCTSFCPSTGVAEDPDGFFADWDDAMDANLAAVIATQDAVILGRRSYTEWAQFWPSSQIQPFASFINGVTKYVATSTPLDREWANAAALEGGLVEFVRDLKQQRGGDIGVHASISVAQALLADDVVDELRLVIAPRIAGRGRRLLDGLPSIQLESIRSEVSPTGSLLVDYRVIR
jgi:dihydrofolate reductase